MKIAVTTFYSPNYEPLAAITIPVLKKYCDKHSYDLFIREYPHNKMYDGKEKMTEAFLRLGKYEFVLVLDIDILITNHTIKVEDLIDDENWLFISKDYNGLNAGAFIIKSCEKTIDFIDFYFVNVGANNIHCEQDALNLYITTSNEGIKYLPQNKINSYLYELYPEIPTQTHEQGQWQKDDFLLHTPGLNNEQRIEVFNKIKEDIIYE